MFQKIRIRLSGIIRERRRRRSIGHRYSAVNDSSSVGKANSSEFIELLEPSSLSFEDGDPDNCFISFLFFVPPVWPSFTLPISLFF